MKNVWMFMCLLALLLMTGLAYAEDEVIFDVPGGDNNPATNEDANDCFRGGVLAGKCSSTDIDMDGDVDADDRAWMWTAGWYLIRFNTGMIDRENFPSYFSTMLPALPETEVSAVPALPSAGCILVGFGSHDYGGGYFLPVGAPGWFNATCAGVPGSASVVASVYAPAPFDPLTLCNLNGTYTSTAGGAGDA
ncbi:MAG: hypothetical protein ACPG7F_11135, partial [Aggregatilineales bacterium]